MKGTEYALTLKVTTYPEGNLAIKLYQESFGQLVFWDSLTANLGGLCPKDCGYINTKSTGTNCGRTNSLQPIRLTCPGTRPPGKPAADLLRGKCVPSVINQKSIKFMEVHYGIF